MKANKIINAEVGIKNCQSSKFKDKNFNVVVDFRFRLNIKDFVEPKTEEERMEFRDGVIKYIRSKKCNFNETL